MSFFVFEYYKVTTIFANHQIFKHLYFVELTLFINFKIMFQVVAIIVLVLILGAIGYACLDEFLGKPDVRVVYYVIGGIILFAILVNTCSGD